MALSILEKNNIQTDYLKNISGNTALELEAPILTITSLGEDPRTFGNINYIEKLKSFHTQNQIGDVNTLNDDIFGILALMSAGVPNNNVVVSDAKNYILLNQNQDGGWGFSASAPSDTNMTAAGILALISSGLNANSQSIQNAANFLKAAQNDDGGFPYDPSRKGEAEADPNSNRGTKSDTASTAWAVWALNALDINPGTWTKANGNPISFLENNQTENGYFEYMEGSGEDAFTPNTTSYAVIALSGKTLPINSISSPYEEEAGKDLFSFRIEGSSGTVCGGETEGPTALDIVKNASSDCGFSYNIEDTPYGPYLNKINNDQAEGLLGWMYAVNSKLPSVGANDYELLNADFVLWHFGEFDWQPTPNNTSRIDMSVVISENDVKGTGTETSTIGFILDNSSLNFGELKPGESKSQTFGITNTGTGDINIEAIVVGDDIFKDNIKLDGSMWSKFKKILGLNQNMNVDANLTIPSNYTGNGQKQGAITIWAQ